ncbi:hypothetical protein EV424DRAFT_1550449 [Suillus variegatus]|nr:hypothetical protein EV424DRAFT_1550449 [Suillus variegatus]
MSLSTELLLSIVDGFTRALLLCSLTPKPIITQASTAIVESFAILSRVHQWRLLHNQHVLFPLPLTMWALVAAFSVIITGMPGIKGNFPMESPVSEAPNFHNQRCCSLLTEF